MNLMGLNSASEGLLINSPGLFSIRVQGRSPVRRQNYYIRDWKIPTRNKVLTSGGCTETLDISPKLNHQVGHLSPQ